MKIDRTILLAAVAFATLAAGVVSVGSRGALIAPPSAQAQNLGKRVVSGAVLDEASEPVVGATVFLKNEKTKAIRSYTSTSKGHFYFAQVNMVCRLRTLGGEGRQEERDQDRQLLGHAQRVRQRSEAEVDSCKAGLRQALTSPAFFSSFFPMEAPGAARS